MEIESSPGQGTTFRICLPIVEECGAVDSEESKTDRLLRVLVVDDEPVSRGVLESYLASEGHSVVTANDAEQALGCFADKEFDLLITDYAMPGMNGVQLAAALREKYTGHSVILSTGFAAGSMGQNEEPAGVDFVLRKPVSRRELRRAIATVNRG